MPKLTKGTHIHKAELSAFAKEAHPGVTAGGLLAGPKPLELAGHA
tara:strand:- start:793 stop:927 length:135 start_codon:yes stop_codon:yes gene_type:complete